MAKTVQIKMDDAVEKKWEDLKAKYGKKTDGGLLRRLCQIGEALEKDVSSGSRVVLHRKDGTQKAIKII